MTTRRAMLAGGAALAVTPWRAGAAANALRTALDAARAQRDPVVALRTLEQFEPALLPPAARLDLTTARAGLAIDAAIAARGIDPRAKPAATRDATLLTLLLRRKVGDGIALDAVTRRLEQERAQAETRAARLFRDIGISGASTGACFTRLWQDAHALYPDSDAGRDAAVAEMNRWLALFAADVPALIGPVPPYCRDVAAIRPSAADLATGHVGVRTLPTPGHPGGYIVDLTQVRDRPRWTLPSVVAHELLPGHMIQLPIEALADPHPLRLDYAPCFPEGWSIAIEQAIADTGAYAHDPRAALGQLHWRLFRIGRALVDLAIHCQGQSLDAARAQLVAWQGEPVAFAPFDADLARIAHDPMTRTAEMLAALAIEDGARGRSGAALRRYHQALLIDGRMRSEEIGRRAET
ncbi:DUF885 family protein [Sphingomonas sp. PAMC 26605]|uniref:DUF885 family protein n=1 Tax=Sphingomonas sp. PAMC 26605 TaxID=1112214 RepID=UPI00026CDC6E|nr:DUF885 family protein [Sphingomonas sp. PAMC 26605]